MKQKTDLVLREAPRLEVVRPAEDERHAVQEHIGLDEAKNLGESLCERGRHRRRVALRVAGVLPPLAHVLLRLGLLLLDGGKIQNHATSAWEIHEVWFIWDRSKGTVSKFLNNLDCLFICKSKSV